jgi:hypothetical protein
LTLGVGHRIANKKFRVCESTDPKEIEKFLEKQKSFIANHLYGTRFHKNRKGEVNLEEITSRWISFPGFKRSGIQFPLSTLAKSSAYFFIPAGITRVYLSLAPSSTDATSPISYENFCATFRWTDDDSEIPPELEEDDAEVDEDGVEVEVEGGHVKSPDHPKLHFRLQRFPP